MERKLNYDEIKNLENSIYEKLHHKAVVQGIPAVIGIVLAMFGVYASIVQSMVKGEPGNTPGKEEIISAINSDKGTINELAKIATSDLDEMVAFFLRHECPSGWDPYEKASGRYVVAMSNDGVLEGKVGKALSDKENRVVGRHSHNIETSGEHTHIIGSSGVHTHDYHDKSATIWHGEIVDQKGNDDNFGINDEKRQTDLSGEHVHTISGAGSHTHGIDSAGTVEDTNAPYIQLLACVRRGKIK